MKWNGITLASLVVGLATSALNGAAITADNPYVWPITNRNAFNLKPLPDPATLIVQPPKSPLPNVLLSGITTLMGPKKAILRTLVPARPPAPAGEKSMMLGERDSLEGIEVIEINIAAGTVSIRNNGEEQLLDITKNAPKGAPSAAPAPPPRGAIPLPPPPAIPAAVISGGLPVTQIRPLRTSGAGDSSAGTVGAGPSGIASPTEPPPIGGDEQMVLIEVERERTKAAVEAGDLPPLPHTEFSEAMELENAPPADPSPSPM